MLRKAAIPQFPKLIVRDILIPDTTSLWVGVDGGGIWILDSETCKYDRYYVKTLITLHLCVVIVFTPCWSMTTGYGQLLIAEGYSIQK